MLTGYTNGQTSVILRVKIFNSSVTTGAGLTGRTNASSGLIISTIADNEVTATVYTVAASHVQTITTIGTYAAPSAGNCRFKEVDATNHPGIYEVQLADARFAVSNAKFLLLTITGATNAAQCDAVIPLLGVNPFDSVHGGMTALPNTACTTNASLLTSGSGTDQLSVSSGKVILQAMQSGVTIPTVTTVTNQLTAAAIATGVWQDTTSGDFTTASSIGKSLYTSGVVPGAAGGLFIAGTNAATTVTTALTTTFTGNLTGSVGSVTGAVGSVGSGGITNASLAVDTGFKSIRSGTAQAGTATTIMLDAGASATNNYYVNDLIVTTGGTGAGQAKFCTAYVGSTKVATVDSAWATTTDSSTTFAILPFSSVPGASAPSAATIATTVWQDLLSGSDFTTSGSVGKLLHDDIDAAVSSRLASASISLSGGAVTVGTNNDKSGYSLTQSFPTNFAALGISAGGHISNVDTLTTYTGNMPQTGDSYAIVNSGTFGNSALNTAIGALPTSILDLADAIETGLTPRQAIRLMVAADAGKLSGVGTGTITIRNAVADSKNRIVATIDGSHNRTSIVYVVT